MTQQPLFYCPHLSHILFNRDDQKNKQLSHAIILIIYGVFILVWVA